MPKPKINEFANSTGQVEAAHTVPTHLSLQYLNYSLNSQYDIVQTKHI